MGFSKFEKIRYKERFSEKLELFVNILRLFAETPLGVLLLFFGTVIGSLATIVMAQKIEQRIITKKMLSGVSVNT